MVLGTNRHSWLVFSIRCKYCHQEGHMVSECLVVENGMKQGIMEQVLDVFTTWIVHVPRSLILLLKLARTNVPKMMYVETQMQPTHQNTKYST